jgi:BNR repeat-containing family member
MQWMRDMQGFRVAKQVFSLLLLAGVACAQNLHVKIVPISDGEHVAQGYAPGTINAVPFRTNAVMTVGNQQFVSFYEPDDDPAEVGHQGMVVIARRDLGSDKWQIFRTHFAANRINDGHDTISMGIDGLGYMHLSWGMHVDAFHYARSTLPVTGSAAIEFGPDESMTGLEKTRITYPQFYNMPNGDLLYFARQGAAGNGDLFFNRYAISDKTWSRVQSPVIRGTYPHWVPANAYWNNLCFDSRGNLICTWVWRSAQVGGGELGYQTNHHIMYARSPDQGKTWEKFDGTAYKLPITQRSADVVMDIPQGCSLMNQTSMAIDAEDRPVIASWWAPDTARGIYSREYMLVYFDGKRWVTSQISHRDSDEPKQPEKTVRDLARPIVAIDKEGRVIVVMSYMEEHHHIMVAYSKDRKNWKYLTLDTTDMGGWEPPAYDRTLWQRENKLDILYEPCALGKPASDMAVLEWDERAFFAEK